MTNCCKKCSESKWALKGKLKDEFNGCGLACECHNKCSEELCEREKNHTGFHYFLPPIGESEEECPNQDQHENPAFPDSCSLCASQDKQDSSNTTHTCTTRVPMLQDSSDSTWGERLEDLVNELRRNPSIDSVCFHDLVRGIEAKAREYTLKDLREQAGEARLEERAKLREMIKGMERDSKYHEKNCISGECECISYNEALDHISSSLDKDMSNTIYIVAILIAYEIILLMLPVIGIR